MSRLRVILSVGVFFLISFNFICHAAKSDIELVFEDCFCNSSDPKGYVSTLYCSLGKNTKRSSLNMDVMFEKDINKFSLNLLIVLPRKADDFVLLNLTNIDGCQLLSNVNQVTLVRLMRANLDRYSNFPQKCPLVKNKAYYIRGFRVDLELLPAFTFETPMYVWYDMIVGRDKIIHSHIESRVSVKNGKSMMFFN